MADQPRHTCNVCRIKMQERAAHARNATGMPPLDRPAEGLSRLSRQTR